MALIRIDYERERELQNRWQEWHHALHSFEITAMQRGPEELRSGRMTITFTVDDRLAEYLRQVGFPFEALR